MFFVQRVCFCPFEGKSESLTGGGDDAGVSARVHVLFFCNL